MLDFLTVEECVLTPDGPWNEGSPLGPPVGFIDLARWPANARLDVLPPFPVVGLGDPTHCLAVVLDAIIEHPVTALAILRQAQGHPRAAATAVQLLRALVDVPLRQALTLESMAYGMLQGSAEHAGWLASRGVAATPNVAGHLHLARAGTTLKVSIDRPGARNAIDCSLRDALTEAFGFAASDPEIKRIELRAMGRAFSVGSDLAEFGTTRDPAIAHLIRQVTLPAVKIADWPGSFNVHVQGACIGAGLEIAAFAEYLTAVSGAWFQLPELAMGLIPGAGGCVSVPRRIGRQRAGLMILSGRRIDAATALGWGLIDAIVDEPPREEHCAATFRLKVPCDSLTPPNKRTA